MVRFLQLMSAAFLALTVVLLALAPLAVPPNVFGDDGGGGQPPSGTSCPNPHTDFCHRYDKMQTDCPKKGSCVNNADTCSCVWDGTTKECRCPN